MFGLVEGVKLEAEEVVVSQAVDLTRERFDLAVDALHPPAGHLGQGICQQALGVSGERLGHRDQLVDSAGDRLLTPRAAEVGSWSSPEKVERWGAEVMWI